MPKKFSTVGCCGIECGLCPRYYTEGTSKCPGCCGDGFEKKHPSCSFVTCCIKKRNLEVCAECSEFPCIKFDRETGETDSFVTHRMVMHNQSFIKQCGIERFIGQQKERMNLLGTMLGCYDDGNCKSFFCMAAALLSPNSLNKAVAAAEQEVKDRSVARDDLKSKAKILKDILSRFADEENVELKLRKAKK